MGEKRKIEKLQRHIDTLQNKIERLEAENRRLKDENEALALKISESESIVKELKNLSKENRESRDAYNKALAEINQLRIDYIKEFESHLKRIRKQK